MPWRTVDGSSHNRVAIAPPMSSAPMQPLQAMVPNFTAAFGVPTARRVVGYTTPLYARSADNFTQMPILISPDIYILSVASGLYSLPE